MERHHEYKQPTCTMLETQGGTDTPCTAPATIYVHGEPTCSKHAVQAIIGNEEN